MNVTYNFAQLLYSHLFGNSCIDETTTIS